MPAAITDIEVNPEILVWARRTANLKQQEIAHACHVNADDVQAWEDGTLLPSLHSLRIIAERCKRPLATFFLEYPPASPALPPEFRAFGPDGVASAAPKTLFAIRAALRAREIALDLGPEAGMSVDFTLPDEINIHDPFYAGAQLRTSLGVSVQDQRSWSSHYQALREWRDFVSSLSVLVLQFPFPLEDARGFSIFDQQLPIIVLNSLDAPTAKCFTLFHELAHLILRHSGVFRNDLLYSNQETNEQEVEIFCNRFAASFLVPSDDASVAADLNRCVGNDGIDEAQILKLARSLKVSRFVILRKLYSLNKVSFQTVREHEARWNAESPQKKRPGPISQARKCFTQRGTTFVSLVLEAADSNRITYADVADYLGMKLKHLDKLRLLIGGVNGG